LKKITELKPQNKKILVRVDYNVPIQGRKVMDTERIEASLDTINWLTSKGGVVVLCSHFGRPEGKRNRKYSLKVVVPTLKKLLGKKITFVSDCIGEKRDKVIAKAKPGEVILLENVRYYPGEEAGDAEFAGKLAAGMDLYVNEAFSASHRAHASVVAVTKILPSYAGYSLQREVENLKKVLVKPKKPFVMVSGGAKISDKIDFLKALTKKIDVLILGGGMANTFLAAEGYEVGKSLYEPDFIDSAEEIKREAEENGVEFILPDDVVVAKKINGFARAKNKSIEEVEKSDYIVDVGPKSVAKFSEPLKFAGTVFWNGPVGIAEYKNFAGGTIGVAKIVSDSKSVSVIGGGDTVSAVKNLNLKFDFISTGGGATLEYLAKGNLPGIEALG
jgi:phosphoglycerate kinase